MKTFATTAAVLLTAAFAHADELSERDLCVQGSLIDGGNWYCQEVDAVTYTGVGNTGRYSPVTNMEGHCEQDTDPKSAAGTYSGPLAPYDEELSLHVRGPLSLKQFAVYTPGNAKSTRDVEEREAEPAVHPHAHAHAHARAHEKREPAVGDWVVQTMDGKVVSWINTWSGQTPAAQPEVHNLAAVAPASAAQTQAPAASAVNPIAAIQGNIGSGSGASSGTYGSSSSTGGWARQAYYSASNGTSQGLSFLNHFGGTGSGTFDTIFGNSLSYATADGKSGSATSQVLKEVTLPSDLEVVITTDKSCDDGKCGYVRPNSVAYHGFAGAEKVFLLEFAMPLVGGTDAGKNDDMPAIWLLNAQIPRTAQYGACSCWTTGCGEFDVFEVLAPGDKRAKSTFHGKAIAGDSDYFPRPTGAPIKLAIVMSNNQAHIKIIDSATDFASSLDSSSVSSWISSTNTQGNRVSKFALTGQ